MAELLDDVSKNVVTTETPRSNLSSGEIAQPYNELAQALDKTGEALGAVAVPLAERQGGRAAQQISRDADGNVVVAPPPLIFGQAGFEYTRALKMGALANADGEAKRADLQLRQQFRDNPGAYDASGQPTGGYLAAAQAFKDKTVQQYTEAMGPPVGTAVGQAIEGTTTQTYRGLLNEKERLDLQRTDSDLAARQKSAHDDILAMARGNLDPNNPDFKRAVDAYTGTLNERTLNPRLAYSPAQRDFDLRTLDGEIKSSRFLYNVNDIYHSKGVQDAEKYAQDIQTNADYKLSPAERDHYYHEAVGEIRANEAIRKQDVSLARAAQSELFMASAYGNRVDPQDVESVAQAFRAAGDPGGAARVYANFARKPLNDDYGRQPLTDQVEQLRGLQGGARNQNPGNIRDSPFARSQPGYTGASGGFAQFDTLESGAQAMAANLRSYAHQGVSTLNQLTAKWAPFGDGANDPVAYAKTIAKATGIDPDAPIDLTDAATVKKIIPAMAQVEQGHSVAGLSAPVGAGLSAPSGVGSTPASAAWLTANREQTLNKELWQGWQATVKDYDEKGLRPSPEAVAEIIDGARAANNSALLEQVSHDMARIDAVQAETRRPLAQQTADITRLQAQRSGGFDETNKAKLTTLSPAGDAVLRDLERRTNAIQEGLKENPIQTAVVNFSDKLKTPPPIDWTNGQSVVAGLSARATISQFASNNWETGPLSALDKQDVLTVKGILRQADAQTKASIYSGIATLPEDVRGATLAKMADKDPAGTAEVMAGSLMANAPDIAGSVFRGQSLMKIDKRNDPEDEGAGSRLAYGNDLDKALPASIFPKEARSRADGPYAGILAMVKARYADLADNTDKSKEYSQDRVNAAVADVTGGILGHNGGDLIAPTRGMSQGDFDRVLGGVTDADLRGVQTLGGQPVTADYLRSNAQLESVKDGRYWVKLGRDPTKPIYAYDTNAGPVPKKFELDLRGQKPGPPQAGSLDQSSFAP